MRELLQTRKNPAMHGKDIYRDQAPTIMAQYFD